MLKLILKITSLILSGIGIGVLFFHVPLLVIVCALVAWAAKEVFFARA